MITVNLYYKGTNGSARAFAQRFIRRKYDRISRNMYDIRPNDFNSHSSLLITSIVRVTGLEPARLAALEPKSNASANSAIPAYLALFYYTTSPAPCQVAG